MANWNKSMAGTPQERQRKEGGYILLVLLLMIAVLTIGFLEATKYNLQYTIEQIKRDHEEELIHRGVQYSRAVRRYFKQFGRYPTRIEDLENTNNIRFLRKRYKDPITGKDFKLLRMNDVQFALNVQIAPNPVRVPAPAQKDATEQQNGGSDGQDNPDPGVAANGDDPQSNDPKSDDLKSDDQDQQSQADSSAASDVSSDIQMASAAASAPPDASANPPQVFGGGPIVGVASLSKAKSLREFNKKDHYNQWQFVYDPSTDSGGLLTTPNQPPLRHQGAPN